MKNGITKEEARELVKDFNEHRNGNRPLPMPSGKGQTKWVWFNRKSLKAILDVLDQEYPTEPYENVGIKFYIGKYNNVQGKPDHNNHLTLVMTPAVKVIQGNDEIIQDHGYNPLEKTIDEEKFIAITTGGTYENWGTICPPNCGNPPSGGDSI